MLLRVLELCLTIIALALTTTEIVLPLIRNQPLLPMIRKTMRSDDSTQQKRNRR